MGMEVRLNAEFAEGAESAEAEQKLGGTGGTGGTVSEVSGNESKVEVMDLAALLGRTMANGILFILHLRGDRAPVSGRAICQQIVSLSRRFGLSVRTENILSLLGEKANGLD